mmetsp:Transcript_24078/g.69211  ORF Transcript_24078/g.69211 Transcript_24078/m.69211 type:complete len:400 (-) Transcript_24078:113-1312(-)
MSLSSPPVTAWGSALGFLPYRDLRSSLRVSRIFRKEVIGEIEVLNIFSPSEMDVPTARRFENVIEVNILCLCRPTSDGEDTDLTDGIEGASQVCPIAVSNIVPFLQSFPRLRRVKIGYYIKGQRHGSVEPFKVFTCFGTDPETNGNSENLFQELIRSLCGALETRSLQSLQTLHVIYYPDARICEEDDDEETSCTLCKRICTVFPLPVVYQHMWLCLDIWERLKVISMRPGGRQHLQNSKILLSFLELNWVLHTTEVLFEYNQRLLSNNVQVEWLTTIRRRIISQITNGSSKRGIFYFVHLDPALRNAIQRVINEYGCDPRNVARKWVLEADGEDRDGVGITKSSLDFLQFMRFDVRSENYTFTLDDSSDEDISHYFDLIRRYESDEQFASSVLIDFRI